MSGKLKIRQKILLYILTFTALLYTVSIGYILINSRRSSHDDAILKTQLSARANANQIAGIFERELSLVRTLSQAFTTYKGMPREQWQKLFLDMYFPVLRENPQIYSLWDSWEYKSFVPGYDKDYGRFVIITWREGNELKWKYDQRSLAGDPPLYGSYKQKGTEVIWEPYLDQFTAGKAETKLMITYSSPILVNGTYDGLVATDQGLESLQEMVSAISPLPQSYAFLVSNTGIIAGHPNKELIFKNIRDAFPNDSQEQNLPERIRRGEEFNYIHTDGQGRQYLACYAPIVAGKTGTPWALALLTPLDVITASAQKSLYFSLGVSVVGLLLMVLILLFVSDNLTRPIRKITGILKRIAQGEISSELVVRLKTGDEIEEMAIALNASIEGLNQKTSFANEIGKGNYNASLELLSEQDILGKSLQNMSESLRKAALEADKRKAEDQKRSWANEGYAKFSEILRQNNSDLQQLCDSVMANLVKYTGANQGGIFLWNDEDAEDQHFELISAFAWDRKKYTTKQLEKGEGLVGACALEKETIFMTEVPDDYVTISSGLGESNPRCIVLIPLKQEDEVLGVIEMASFKVLERFEVEFIEKIAESIASTILSVRVNARTKMLLEQSQSQTEIMKAQEEEMRQNIEELQVTQEEVARKSGEIENFVRSINSSAYVVEYDLDGNITDINDAFLLAIGALRNQVIGLHHSSNLVLTEQQKKEYGTFWDSLRQGIPRKTKSRHNWDGRTVELLETYIPVKDAEGRVSKVMKLAFEAKEFSA